MILVDWKMMILTLREFPITRCHQLTKSLKTLEFHLESDDSDNDVYDNNEDDEFEAEGHTTQ